jgi:hypothetical protein
MLLSSIKASYRQSPLALRMAFIPFVILCRILSGKAAIRVGLWMLNGRELHSGHALGIAFSGTEQNKNYWARIAFGGPCEERYLGRYWCWEVPGVIRSSGVRTDLAAEQRCLYLSALSRKPGCLYLPVSVEGDMVPELIGLSDRAVRGDIRRIEKNGFQYEIETDPSVLEEFVHTAYLTHLKNKYPGEYIPATFRQITCGFRQTEGLFVTRENRRVAGMLLCQKGGKITLKCPSIIPGCEALIKDGATQALYYFTSAYLKEKGISKISYGGTRPFFRDGVLVWKKKWGLRLTRSGVLVQRISAVYDGSGVRSFLMKNPFIITDRGNLEGVVFISGLEDASPPELDKLSAYVWPGLTRVIVYCLDQIPAAADAVSERHQGKIIFRSAAELFAAPDGNKVLIGDADFSKINLRDNALRPESPE